MIYRSFPKRAFHFADEPTTFERKKARLIAVLTVFDDVAKVHLTVIVR